MGVGYSYSCTPGGYMASQAYQNESTAGADVSVEVPKLHNIKLLLYIHTSIIIMMNIFNFTACKIQNQCF